MEPVALPYEEPVRPVPRMGARFLQLEDPGIHVPELQGRRIVRVHGWQEGNMKLPAASNLLMWALVGFLLLAMLSEVVALTGLLAAVLASF